MWPGPCSGASVAPASVGAGPDEREALAILVVEEVSVDGGVETRIVELEAQIVAALIGALGPGGADLGAANQHAVAGGVFAGGAPVFLKVPMVAMTKSPFFVFEPAPCGLDGDRRAGGDRRRIACDRSKAEDGAGAAFLPREEWVKPRGRKS